MSAVRQRFPSDEVDVLAINWGEDRATVEDYIVDTGITVPVLLDDRDFAADETPGCYRVPDGANSLTELLWQKVGDDKVDPPFPLQMIVAPDGTFAYLARNHDPDRVIQILEGLVPKTPR